MTDIFSESIGSALNSVKKFISGSTLSASLANTDKSEPGAVTTTPPERVIYPDGLDSAWAGPNKKQTYGDESGPLMRITAFEYVRGFDTTQKRSIASRKFSIFLPSPGNLQSGFSANWGQFAGGLVSAATQGRSGAEAAATAVTAGAAAKVAEDAAKSLKGFPGLTEAIQGALDETTRNVASAALGVAMNPRQEVAFNGMNIRTHSFQYQLTPRNAKEAKSCLRLIYLMQRAMHPTYTDPAKLGLNYPYEFIVEFFTADGVKQPGLLPIPDSYLTSFNVVYNPGQVTAKYHVDGNPLSFQIQMQFTEGVALTRDEYDILASGAGISE